MVFLLEMTLPLGMEMRKASRTFGSPTIPLRLTVVSPFAWSLLVTRTWLPAFSWRTPIPRIQIPPILFASLLSPTHALSSILKNLDRSLFCVRLVLTPTLPPPVIGIYPPPSRQKSRYPSAFGLSLSLSTDPMTVAHSPTFSLFLKIDAPTIDPNKQNPPPSSYHYLPSRSFLAQTLAFSKSFFHFRKESRPFGPRPARKSSLPSSLANRSFSLQSLFQNDHAGD